MAIYRSASRYGARRPVRKAYKPRARPSRASRYSGVVTVPRTISTGGGFPEKMITTLRYVETLTLTTTTGTTPGLKIFRLNSAYDPNYSDAGHQPLYYDQLAAIYSRYQVLGSKINAKFAVQSMTDAGAPNGPWLCGISANNDGTFSSDANTLCEQNKTVFKRMTHAEGGPAAAELTLTYVPKRDLGLDGMDDAVGAAINTNPNQTYWGQVWVSNANPVSTAYVSVTVTVDLKCCFIRQSNIAGS